MPGKKQHCRGRGAGRFEKCRAAGAVRETGLGLQRKRAWACLAAFRRAMPPRPDHFRAIPRAAALPGKHVRHVEEPARSMHGKNGL